jgi:hypothetical protein
MDAFLHKMGLFFLIKNSSQNKLANILHVLESQLKGSDTQQTIKTDDLKNKEKNDNITINLSQFRSPDSFNTQTKKILNMVTSGNDISPVGSLKYTVHRYPGDIDIYEEIISCCTLQEASNDIVKKIQDIAVKIMAEPLIFLSDFKAGVDKRYEIPELGKISPNNTIVDYSPSKIKETCVQLKQNKLFTNKEFTAVIKLIKKKPTISEWHTLQEYMRSFYILRWDLFDLINGYIHVRSTVDKKNEEIKIKLVDAIQDKAICKLDLWAPINGKYIEITNFLVFIYMDEDGQQHIINTNIDNYIESLIIDLKQYGKGGYKYNALKYAKRLWSLANTLDDTNVLKSLFPLFSSGAAILYQISAEIEVLISILEEVEDKPLSDKQLKDILTDPSIKKKSKDIIKRQVSITESPVPLIINQIDNFKSRIGLVYEQFHDSEKLFTLVNTITQFYNSQPRTYLRKKEKKIIIDILQEIDTVIQTYVNSYALSYLSKHKLDNVCQYDYVLST